jgi:hypothetical protein
MISTMLLLANCINLVLGNEFVDIYNKKPLSTSESNNFDELRA